MHVRHVEKQVVVAAVLETVTQVCLLENRDIQLTLTDFQFRIFSTSETVSPYRTMWNLVFAFLAFFIALV